MAFGTIITINHILWYCGSVESKTIISINSQSGEKVERLFVLANAFYVGCTTHIITLHHYCNAVGFSPDWRQNCSGTTETTRH